MDSLTQIVLGAACGEAVLGKKIGNRAMLWGAIGGTIPDLDVFASFVTDEITALAFHRGFMHSLVFAFLFPAILGWMVWKLYQTSTFKLRKWRLLVLISSSLFLLAVVGGVNAIPWIISGQPYWPFLVAGLISLGLYGQWARHHYLNGTLDTTIVQASFRDWYFLFFWSILTHPILDAFTNYGTQLFQPFFNNRIAFNTVSVVDPLYTVPFGLTLIACLFLNRNSIWRRRINVFGIVYSCLFLALTVFNKFNVERVVARSLANQGIKYNRLTTNPSIFQNVLWYTVVEADSNYYFGMYSLLDRKQQIDSFCLLPMNKELIAAHQEDRDIKTLIWFSNNYYNVTRGQADTLEFHDLRFGLQSDTVASNRDYIFRFNLAKNPQGQLCASQVREQPKGDEFKSVFGKMWTRIQGI